MCSGKFSAALHHEPANRQAPSPFLQRLKHAFPACRLSALGLSSLVVFAFCPVNINVVISWWTKTLTLNVSTLAAHFECFSARHFPEVSYIKECHFNSHKFFNVNTPLPSGPDKCPHFTSANDMKTCNSAFRQLALFDHITFAGLRSLMHYSEVVRLYPVLFALIILWHRHASSVTVTLPHFLGLLLGISMLSHQTHNLAPTRIKVLQFNYCPSNVPSRLGSKGICKAFIPQVFSIYENMKIPLFQK